MLDTSVTQGFIQNIHNTQDTDQTMRVKAVMARHKETTGEHDWLRKGPPTSQTTSPTDNETSEKQNTQLDWKLTGTPALEQLQELAANAVEEAERRYRQENLTVAILETMANGKTLEDTGATTEMGAIAMLQMPSTRINDEVEVTRFEVPAIPKSDSGSARKPRKYQNATVSPYVLLLAAINENKRYMGPTSLPSKIYVSDVVMFQLHKDMKILRGEDFNGHSIPFSQSDGIKVDIPVVSAKAEYDIDLPFDTVYLLSGITS